MYIKTGRGKSRERASLPPSAALLLLVNGCHSRMERGMCQNGVRWHWGAEPFTPPQVWGWEEGSTAKQ